MYTAIEFFVNHEFNFGDDIDTLIVDPTFVPGVTGFNVTPDGKGFLGIAAGSDSTYPVCLILYTDADGEINLYIPRAGNVADWENQCPSPSDAVATPFDRKAMLADIAAFLKAVP